MGNTGYILNESLKNEWLIVNPNEVKCSVASKNIAMCGNLFVYILLLLLTIILCSERVIIYFDDI